ncbi:uncharacterized protein LOC143270060 isoform X2 [Peromyscus maniculatus bairdii]|uniref:uncharacterized protein LOC143270060 isoform X2 n=1 Tax=Peromyscus maniculatus bairdii TaxID=230844 RepID=UPI003FD37DAC
MNLSSCEEVITDSCKRKEIYLLVFKCFACILSVYLVCGLATDIQEGFGSPGVAVPDGCQPRCGLLHIVSEKRTPAWNIPSPPSYSHFWEHTRRHAAAPDIISNVVPGSIRVPGYDT